MSRRGVCVLGSTGSIGKSTLDVIGQHADRFDVFALTANTDVETLLSQCLTFKPKYAVLRDASSAAALEKRLKQSVGDAARTQVLAGEEGLLFVVAHSAVSDVMAAIVGGAGLKPTLHAALAGKRVLLANKEPLVMAGALFMQAVQEGGATLIPIDSEHNAIFQCMPQGYRCGYTPLGIRRILLTASGGPFRTRTADQLRHVSVQEACAHPNWSMGKKISIDSATLMNKGLEFIEAYWLFQLKLSAIEILVHPESVIHSLVEYENGSVLAQLGCPDMRIPIAHAMGWPDVIASGVTPLDLLQIGALHFEAPDFSRFPCLRLAKEAISSEGLFPAVLNAANEVAVAAFLEERIPFLGIAAVVEETLSHFHKSKFGDMACIEEVLEVDLRARHVAEQWIREKLNSFKKA